jgi:Mg-chelatase subunit ChlD
LSYDESKAKDLFFIIDGSRSMKEKVKSAGMSKMEIVRQGLLDLVREKWPVSYTPWPLRIGIAFYRLLGTPGKTEFDVVVPMAPPPASLELYRLTEMPCKGGSPLVDALRFSMREVSESLRGERRIKLISDGGNDGEPVKTCADELKGSRVPLDAIELSNGASQELRDIAALSGGKYYRPNSLAEFKTAIRE